MPGVNSITNVAFNGERYARVDIDHALFQYDYGQVLHFVDVNLPSVFEAHFSNDPIGQSKSQIGTGGYVTIPDSLLRSGLPVYCFVYLHDDDSDGRTEYRVDVPVVKRAAKTFERINVQDATVISQLISALNECVDRAENIATDVASEKTDAETARAYAESAKDRAVSAAETVNAFLENVSDGDVGSVLTKTGAETDAVSWTSLANDYNGDNTRPVTASFLYSEIQRISDKIDRLITENGLSYTDENNTP